MMGYYPYKKRDPKHSLSLPTTPSPNAHKEEIMRAHREIVTSCMSRLEDKE